jgi:hypothetical protein
MENLVQAKIGKFRNKRRGREKGGEEEIIYEFGVVFVCFLGCWIMIIGIAKIALNKV